MIHEELWKRREAIGMTRIELAEKMSVREQTIQNWEKGKTINLHPLIRNEWQKVIVAAEILHEEEQDDLEKAALQGEPDKVSE